jgi:G-patch domain
MGPVGTLPPTSRLARFKRPEIQFREESQLETVEPGQPPKPDRGEVVASFYRSITTPPVTVPSTPPGDGQDADSEDDVLLLEGPPVPTLCPVCNLPLPSNAKLQREHNRSTAHLSRVVDPRPTPLKPLPLDSYKVGYKVLHSQGWSEKDREGLGAEGNRGRREPVKPSRVKNDTVGLGIKKDKVKEVARENRGMVSGKEIRRRYEREKTLHKALMEYMNH